MKLFRTSLLIAACTLFLAGTASAQTALVNYVGFGYETDGLTGGSLDPSNPGDVLTVLTVASAIDPVFGAQGEVTIVLRDLESQGEFIQGDTKIITYTGGTLSLYDDGSTSADWGTNPPNGTAPSSFEDGTLLFEGTFTTFTLFLSQSGGFGAYEGDLDATGGAALASICSSCAYSFAGVFTDATGAQIPEGYDFQVDGTLEVDSSIDTAPSSFGDVKSRFGN